MSTRGHKYFPLTVYRGLSADQSDAGWLVHSHFGFGSDPSMSVRVISGKAGRGRRGGVQLLDNGSHRSSPLSLSSVSPDTRAKFSRSGAFDNSGEFVFVFFEPLL